ncbi:hypothetical protein [Schaalia vaccimaxillae]|uniref:hypothetical protein n=1 Tax=Schaalia vaccimaxillae TaxID=183916 RepID=UPI0003B55148|nr:hypothetical protein [Schaalia vaccimaxillae]
MGMPDMNPLAAKLMGGADFRRKLKQQLEDAADATDDPSYRQRLLDVANGKRPLRTLLADPAFADQVGMRTPQDGDKAEAEFRSRLAQSRQDPDSPWRGTSEEVQENIKDRLTSLGVPIADTEELKSVFEEAVSLRDRAESVIRDEESNGWGGSVERLAERDAQAQGRQPG